MANPQDMVEASYETRLEMRAYDALPCELREFIRLAPIEISARKTLVNWMRRAQDTRATLAALQSWLDKQPMRRL